METEEDFVPEVTTPRGNKKYDANNRGAKMIDQFGKTEYKRRQIDLGLSQEVLPPITRRGIAKYRVIMADPTADPQDLYLPGSYIFYDKHEPDPSKRHKEIKNATGRKIREKLKDGTEVLEDEVEMLILPSGVITVNMESEYRKYVALELHPNNKTNKFRDTSVVPAFERIDFQQNRSNAFRVAEEELAEDAVMEIRKMKDVDTIRGIAVSAGVVTMEGNLPRDISLVKTDLRNWAWANPRKFFSLSKDSRTAIRIALIEAESVGVIEYQHDTKKWIGVKTDEPLHVVMAGEDPWTSLVEFFMTDKKAPDLYKAIQNLTDRWDM